MELVIGVVNHFTNAGLVISFAASRGAMMKPAAPASPLIARFHAPGGTINTRPICTKWATISSLSSWDIAANIPSLGHRV